MTQELEGRVAIVTGAGRNIGRGIALALADGGAAVVVNARSNMQEAQAVVGEIERAGGRGLAVTADVAEPAAVQRMADAAAQKFGRSNTRWSMRWSAGAGSPTTSPPPRAFSAAPARASSPGRTCR